MFKVLLLEKAINGVQEAYNWYEEQREGLGEELMSEINKCYEKLSGNPQHYSFSAGG